MIRDFRAGKKMMTFLATLVMLAAGWLKPYGGLDVVLFRSAFLSPLTLIERGDLFIASFLSYEGNEPWRRSRPRGNVFDRVAS